MRMSRRTALNLPAAAPAPPLEVLHQVSLVDTMDESLIYLPPYAPFGAAVGEEVNIYIEDITWDYLFGDHAVVTSSPEYGYIDVPYEGGDYYVKFTMPDFPVYVWCRSVFYRTPK